MNQSSVIGAALLIAYIIFVINKGELPCYFQVLGIATAAQCPTPLTTSGCGSSASTASGANAILPGRTGGINVGGIIGGIGGIIGGLGGLGGGLGPI
jgi:hypothetical protein